MRLVRGLLVLLVGCDSMGSDEETTDPTNPQAARQVDCADPASNPWAGTCVETFLAGCFDPLGTCDGTYDAMGSVTLTWDNGAVVATTTDLSDPFSPGVLTEIYASDGALCAVGTSSTSQGGACFSETVYERQSDGATQTWCIQQDSTIVVTCDDGGSVTVTPEESEAANTCQYGDEAGACEMRQG